MVKILKETELNKNETRESENFKDTNENNIDNSENLGVKELSANKSLFSNYYLLFYCVCLIFSIFIYFAPKEIEFVLEGADSVGVGVFILNIISIISAKWLWVLSLLGCVLSFFKKYFSDFVMWYTVFVVMVISGSILSLIL